MLKSFLLGILLLRQVVSKTDALTLTRRFNYRKYISNSTNPHLRSYSGPISRLISLRRHESPELRETPAHYSRLGSCGVEFVASLHYFVLRRERHKIGLIGSLGGIKCEIESVAYGKVMVVFQKEK
ncbi:hypothetical protein CEXT_412631 [Caerostris extrusa]|uniref:Secreted protein n=1 Tax=Caerostris extrusa TaxID=172846 RepID=A0AAV4P1E5_CAEEX|nr:hypothetical protein CEXT_412631 [Caerostris extrusa]